jgi:hypothetical protein
MAAIFEGSENPDPCAVAAALEPNAASARAYLVVMNGKVGFTLLHHLQRVDWEIWPGDPIANQIVAFEGDIRPQGPTPNIVVFNEAKDTLFRQFNLPLVCLVETNARYSSRANGNDQSHMFVVDPLVTARVAGAVTRMIPIPMEWAPMFVDGPNFGTAFCRVFGLFNSLDKDDRTGLYPVLEMIGIACCTANDSDMPPSTLSTQWTRLTYHAWTKRWAAEVWARHSDPVEQALPEHEDPLPPVAASPVAQLQDLFGQRRKRLTGGPAREATTPRRRSPPNSPQPHLQSAKTGMELGDLGSIMVIILESQAELSLCLHQNLLENIRVTSAAVGATGTPRDARLSDPKLRILQACAGCNDGIPFVPSKLYLKVNREGGTTDTFSRVLCRLVITVPGSLHKCNVNITSKIVLAAKTLNFSANDDLTFDGCSNGITPFATPWRTADANNSDLAEDHYFHKATLKSPADIKRHAMGAKFEPPQSLHGLVCMLMNLSASLKSCLAIGAPTCSGYYS